VKSKKCYICNYEKRLHLGRHGAGVVVGGSGGGGDVFGGGDVVCGGVGVIVNALFVVSDFLI
jgi:hypothetical protein